MVDVAELALRIRSDEAEVAEDRLSGMAQAADRAETQVDGLGRAMVRVDAHTANMNRALAAAERQTKAMSQAGLNMGRQFTDVGVSLATGMNPFMVILQQAPQIMDGFQVAAMQMGTSVRGAMAAMGAAIWTALAPLLPIIAGVAAGAALIGGSFALATRAASKEIGDLTVAMNLSEKQLKRLAESGESTGVTMGDVFRGIGTTIKEVFVETFGSQLDWVSRKWNEFLDFAWQFAVGSAKNIGTAFVGAFFLVRDTWKMIPAALGDATVSAANLVIGGVESMINFGVRLLNKLISAANKAVDAIPGMDAFIPELSEVRIARVANQYAGAMTQIVNAGAAAVARARGVVDSAVDGVVGRVISNTRASGQARVGGAAGDADAAAIDRATGAMGRQAEQAIATAEAVEVLDRATVNLTRSLDGYDFGNVPTVEKLELLRLTNIASTLDLIHERAVDAGRGMADAFGRVGASIGDAVAALTGYATRLAEVDRAEQAYRNASQAFGADEEKLADFRRQRAIIELQQFGDLTKAAKTMFGERTAGYKALAIAEQAFRAIEFAMAVKSVAMSAWETATKIPHYLAQASAAAAAGAANMFAALGPFGFAAVGAMVAVLASLGFKGGGGGGASYTPPTPNTGTGTVLGDASAESNSIGRSLEMARQYQQSDLTISRGMLDALRNIESGIGAVTTAIARSFEVSGALSAEGLNLGSTTSRSLFGLLSTTRSSQLVGSGLDLNGGQLADLIANGVTGSLVRVIENTKTKSGFLGIGGGTTTWQTETRTAMDNALGQELGRLLGTLRTGVLTAASTLGLEGAQATLDALQINLGRIDFTGLSSSEISQRLNAVFSAVGDQMALALLPQLSQFQQAGEGLMETLVRLATQVQTVDARLQAMGMALNLTGIEGIAARDRLVQLSGGLEEFLDQTSFFAENFLTEAQRIAPVQAYVTAELTRLGLATAMSRDQFAALVLGLDVSTEAGASMFAALMHLAPAFDQVATHLEDTATRVAEQAARLADQRRNLEIQLMEATGQSAAALQARRDLELAGMDATLHALQLQLWAAQDARAAQDALARAQDEAARSAQQYQQQLLQNVETARGVLSQAYEREASALQGVIDRFGGFSTSLRAFRDSLTVQSGGVSLAQALADLNRTSALARLGNEDAFGRLQGVSQTYIDTLTANASSRLEVDMGIARVRRELGLAADTADRQKSLAEQQLDALKDQVRGFIDLNENVISVRDAILSLQGAMGLAGVSAFAMGGVFRNGVVTSPTMFNMGLMGEESPEAIMPLHMGPDGLGVRAAANDNGGETQALREEVAMLRTAIEAVASHTASTARTLERMDTFGTFVRGEDVGDPVEVKVVNTADEPVLTEAA